MKSQMLENFEQFFEQFLSTLVWSSKPEHDPRSESEILETLEDSEREVLRAHCLSFFSQAYPYITDGQRFSDPYEQAGHDFCLTMCKHGAGFWDGDWVKHSKLLTKLSHCYPEELPFDEFFAHYLPDKWREIKQLPQVESVYYNEDEQGYEVALVTGLSYTRRGLHVVIWDADEHGICGAAIQKAVPCKCENCGGC